ncbi:replication initiation protein [Profundibacterium mesophilum]|uniref:Plasmid replication initiation protein n=1 Tax=Profundibacterium mesophilum KAUST100406-0324 TaxID=1037889 RepID=A0A921NR98_9RHOB|nr:replication initiation protein [Profundibacterium mesophilum]KAF0676037.1 Plasmid replication initiation protein [Profundibacterium mesophilum KAUST100406-0324]
MAQVAGKQLTGALKRNSVKKNVAAIHVSGKLTLLQRKLSNVLLLNAYDTLITQQKHTIDARTLAMMIGYNSNDMKTLQGALRGLAETVAEWDMLDDRGRQEWGVSALLSYAKLRGGVCEYAYSPALAEKLHDPKVFALINLNIQKRFTSGHGLALYENCYRFVRTGSTGWWSLETFRRLMGIDGSAYYETFKHLNAKIIKPAVEEVNRNSNIEVTPEFSKKGRAVSEIRFAIRENPQLPMFEIDDDDAARGSAVYGALMAQGISDRLARQWIAEHGERAVTEKLSLVVRQKNVKNPAGYLRSALENGYGISEAKPSEPSPEAVAARAARDAANARAAEQEDARAAEKAERKRRFAQVQDAVSRRNPTQRDADRQLFLSSLTSDLEREEFQRHGWSSALNAAEIYRFWCEISPDLSDDDIA